MLDWLLAAALATASPAPPLETPPASEVPLTPAQVTAVPAALETQFRQTVMQGRATPRERVERLVAFMFDEQGLGLHYDDSATLSVEQAYAAHQANCLTFTLVFLALAREAGLVAWPQEIRETLTWFQDETTVYRNSHVNAVVRAGADMFLVDVSGNRVIALDHPVRISEQQLLSHYYNNLAIGLLTRNDTVTAAVYSSRALALAPDHPDHWSNAGVIHARNGDFAAAAQAHARALALDPDNAGALFNSAALAHRLGDTAAEAQYRQRLNQVQQRDPFHHFLLAMDYERRGDYPLAVRHYRRAIQLHGSEHRFLAALARTYLAMGEVGPAARALSRARGLSQGPARQAYEEQLARLRRGDSARHPPDPGSTLRR